MEYFFKVIWYATCLIIGVWMGTLTLSEKHLRTHGEKNCDKKEHVINNKVATTTIEMGELPKKMRNKFIMLMM